MYIISRCLLGVNCKYNGGNNLREDVVEFTQGHAFITICPESAGGLTSPREPAEVFVCQKGLRVIDRTGKDVTDAFVRGAKISVSEILSNADIGDIEGAILKANSPSCGAGHIYDGTFTGNVVPGNGIFAQMLVDRGIKVATESDYREIYGESSATKK